MVFSDFEAIFCKPGELGDQKRTKKYGKRAKTTFRLCVNGPWKLMKMFLGRIVPLRGCTELAEVGLQGY